MANARRMPHGITDTAMMKIALAERPRSRCRQRGHLFCGPDDGAFHDRVTPLVLRETHDRPHIPARQGISLREILNRRTAGMLRDDFGVARL
jgi:hypothetical protein